MSEAIQTSDSSSSGIIHGLDSKGENLMPDQDNNHDTQRRLIVVEGNDDDDEKKKKTIMDDDDDDDEGLLKSYDVIVCGTGLTHSILAAALSRAGKTVLHVDGADHYGGLDAVWTFPFLQCQWKNKKSDTTIQATSPSAYTTPEESSLQDSGDGGVVVVDRQSDMSTTTTTTTAADVNGIGDVPLHEEGETQSLIFHSVKRHTPKTISMGQIVVTPYGTGTLVHIAPVTSTREYHQLTISLSKWKLANGTAPTLYVGIPSSAVIFTHDDDSTNTVDAQYLWQHSKIQTWQAYVSSHIFDRQSRSLALDLTPYFIYADGTAVHGLIESSVSEYLEFKSLRALYLVSTKNENHHHNHRDHHSHRCTRVPCSKNDIFASKLLSPMDKRRLMKFLQTAMDFAAADDVAAATTVSSSSEMTEDALDEVQFLNERHLNQGRSLSRPQNKPVNSTDLEHLQDLCRHRRCQPPADGSETTTTTPLPPACQFETYLREHQKLSPELISLVRYALTLETGDESFNNLHPGTAENTTKSGMQRLCAHMRALGRFGTTAFLVPLYGSGELTQAFCRCAAVYGATYLLRRTPVGIRLQTSDCISSSSATITTTIEAQQSPEDGGSKRSVQAVLLKGSPENPQNDRTKTIACTHVIVSEGALMAKRAQSSGKRVLRRISILSGKPMTAMTDDEERSQSQPEQQQRHVVIIPPGTIVGQTSTIHVIFLDEGVNVAPHVPGGCTIAHLTTTVQNNTSNDVPVSLLKDALQLVLDLCSSNKTNPPGTTIPAELFHASFSYELFPKDELAWSDCTGMHVLHRPRPGLSADQSFEQAAQVFHDICPEQDFLKISQDLERTIQERLGDQAPEDDDKRVLESALEMIGALSTEKASDANMS